MSSKYMDSIRTMAKQLVAYREPIESAKFNVGAAKYATREENRNARPTGKKLKKVSAVSDQLESAEAELTAVRTTLLGFMHENTLELEVSAASSFCFFRAAEFWAVLNNLCVKSVQDAGTCRGGRKFAYCQHDQSRTPFNFPHAEGY